MSDIFTLLPLMLLTLSVLEYILNSVEVEKMPDGDKFERRLRGRGWAKAYRLASGNAEWGLLRDSLITAAAFALRNQAQCPSLAEVTDTLRKSLASPSRNNFGGGSGVFEAFEQLCHSLDDIEARDRNYIGTQLACQAAAKVFADQSRQTEIPAKQEILDRLGEEFVLRLIDNQWLSPVREGIAESNSRTTEQQADWEQNLKEMLKPQARKLFQNALRADNAKAVRAPKRTATTRPIEVLLNEPLVVLDR